MIDGPASGDPAVRPNQIVASAMGPDLLTPMRAQSILALADRELLTPVGTRTPSPSDPSYLGQSRGTLGVAMPPIIKGLCRVGDLGCTCSQSLQLDELAMTLRGSSPALSDTYARALSVPSANS